MSSHTDAVAQAARAAAVRAPVQIRLATITDLQWRPITTTSAALTLYADFGSGGVQVAALQSVLDDLSAREAAAGGSSAAYAVGRVAVTLTPAGNGMPIVVGYVGSILTNI